MSAIIPLPPADAGQLDDAAAKIPEPAPPAESVAAALDAAKPVGEGAAAAAAADKPAKAKAAPKRGKGVARIVDELSKAMHFITDKAGNVYRYDESRGAWEQQTEMDLLAIAYRQDVRSSMSKRNAIVAQIKVSTHVHKLVWGRVADSEIPCANGIVDVITGEMRPHAPENLLERVLPVAWNPKAECPTWMRALDIWFPAEKDGGRRAALQEFFGYICLAHAKYKKALVLYGDSDTGKSQPAVTAKHLVGIDYTCALGVEDMDDPVRRALLKGKALNLQTELSADAMVADGGFKTLVSTEEPISINAKYLAPETYVYTGKMLIVTNNLPKFNDHTAAMFNRLLIIPFTEVLPEAQQDRGIIEKFKAELEGILLWAAEGARRLVERSGQWPEVEAARSIIANFREDMNPIRQFMQERMMRVKDAVTPLRDIAFGFNQWNTGSRNFGIRYVGKLLRATGRAEAIKEVKYKGRTLTCLLGFRMVAGIDENISVEKTTGTLSDAGLEVMVGKLAKDIEPDGDVVVDGDDDDDERLR